MLAPPLGTRAGWLGIGLAAAIALTATALAQLPAIAHLGLSALPLAIVIGIAGGNTFFPAIAPRTAVGVDYARQTLLRAGIVLYGFRITFQQIGQVGWAGVLIDATMLTLTFVLAVQVGTRLFKLDRESAMLIGAGASICGAAAVMATEPVLRAPAHKVSVAVATVVVFGTLGMVIYPLLYPHLGLSEHAYGVFTGSTVHEVAQVVAAGRAVSESAAAAALIEKMLRVMMLAPFLLVLSLAVRNRGGASAQARHLNVPWFAVAFIGASAVSSLSPLPPAWNAALASVDTLLLATAMAALGLRTHAGAVRQAGTRPLLLASLLFGFLLGGGYLLNRAITLLSARL
jgi:uncharacterized integral membrane protein (TIGR00698 family)